MDTPSPVEPSTSDVPCWWADLPWTQAQPASKFRPLAPALRHIDRADLQLFGLTDFVGFAPPGCAYLAHLFYNEVVVNDDVPEEPPASEVAPPDPFENIPFVRAGVLCARRRAGSIKTSDPSKPTVEDLQTIIPKDVLQSVTVVDLRDCALELADMSKACLLVGHISDACGGRGPFTILASNNKFKTGPDMNWDLASCRNILLDSNIRYLDVANSFDLGGTRVRCISALLTSEHVSLWRKLIWIPRRFVAARAWTAAVPEHAARWDEIEEVHLEFYKYLDGVGLGEKAA